MVSTVSILFVSFFLLLDQGQCCEDDWLLYNDQCYHIYSALTVTKRRAEIDCHLKNSNLVSISSKGRWEFLTNEVKKVNGSRYWVGLTRKEGTLEWENGKFEESSPWVRVTDILGYGEDECFVLKNDNVVTQRCSGDAGYICEKHQNPENNTIRISCLQQEDQKKICLWFVSESLTKDAGEQACARHDGRLAVLDGRQKEVFAKFLILLKPGSYWIGLNKSKDIYLWTTGDQLDETNLLWSFEKGSGSGSCVTMDSNLTIESGTQWNLRDCNEEAFSLCEDVKLETITLHPEIPISTTEPSISTTLEPQTRCPEGNNWVDNGRGFCYWETSYETEKLPWADARRYCQGFGGDLASIHSYDDERKGYLFQALLLGHTYWIGLTYNYTARQFDWSDKTELTYTNWADNQPQTNDRRLRCVSVNPRERAWEVNDCSNLNWFVCKAPKSVNPPPFSLIPPSLEPLIPCASNTMEYFFNGYCYSYVSSVASWNQAKRSCETSGAQLVSIHSTQETNFLRRLVEEKDLADDARIWTGLHHIYIDGTLAWVDKTAVDYTNWNPGESIISRHFQRCCFIYPNGLWHCSLCYVNLGYICKRPNITETTTVISTTTEAVANCKNGWNPLGNKCYLPIGENPDDQKTWTEANDVCKSFGANLVSVHSSQEQEFLEYLMTKVQTHTWIGLHDHIDDSAYVWADNSRMDYSNWAFGEPSNYEYKEDCVKLSYKISEYGHWRDDDCNRKHPFICGMDKDPSIPTPWTTEPNSPCTVIGGYQLGQTCYLVYDKEELSHVFAEEHCADKDGKLVSIRDITTQVFLKYLVSNTETYFWTSLSKKIDGTFYWKEGWPVTFTNWGENQPGLATTSSKSLVEPMCYLMSSSGLWVSQNCSYSYPYICEITKEKPPPRVVESYQGSCPTNSRLWKDVGNRFCYIYEPVTTLWRKAYMRCSQQGGNLASIHSEEELINISKLINKPEPIFIGLAKNRYGGFAWTDGTPLNFIKWDEKEKELLDCVEMKPDNLTWRTVNCVESRGFLCSIEKELTIVTASSTQPASSNNVESDAQVQEISRALSAGAVTGIVICVLVMIFIGIGVALHFRSYVRRRKNSLPTRSILSFENSIYMDNTNEI